MAAQQRGANEIGAYFSDLSPESLHKGVTYMRDALTGFKEALTRAHQADIAEGDYYYKFNEWIQKELNQKIAKWEAAP